MKKELTMEQYIAMCDRYESAQFQCENWWPTVREIQTRIEPKVEQNLEFLIWVSETAPYPKTPEQHESRNYINKLLKDTLVFVDEAPKSSSESEEYELDEDDEEEEVE